MTTTPPLSPAARPRPRLWLALSLLGGAAFACAFPYFLQVFAGLAAKAGKPMPPMPVLFLAEGVKALVLCAAFGALGSWAAPRVGLDAPLLRARLAGESIGARLGALVPRGLLWGTLASMAVLGLNVACSPWLPEAMQLRHQVASVEGSRVIAALVGASSAFYGGVVEEILVRWGLLAALMVAAARFLPRTGAFVVANVLSAALFGLGHLPLALQLGGGAHVVVYTVVANMVAGLVFGWLFFKHGLEQAIVAHAWTDVVLHALPLLVFLEA